MHWILAHFIGDFLFQNDWMQKKTTSNLHCTIHVVVYLVPFLVTGLPWWKIVLIGVQHFLQDRLGWAVVWQKFVRQTPPEKWPTGRLIVDQVIHILFLYWIAGL